MQGKADLKPYQKAFIDFAIQKNALRFGEFTLKSGRTSPYFFNAGLFNDGQSLAQLGHFYAQTLNESGLSFDLLFGPAYKGIPLASVTACSLYKDFQRNTPFAFNRKEAKDHGEGGTIVGAPLHGRVMIIDDVITAGTAIREVLEIIRHAGAEPAGVVVALDRQEKGKGNLSAIQEIRQEYDIPITSIITLNQLLNYLNQNAANTEHAQAMEAYRNRYGTELY